MDFFNIFNKTQFIATSINTSFSNNGTVCTALAPCAGYANDTLKWDPSLVQGNFGVNSAAKDGRQIQYGLKIDF